MNQHMLEQINNPMKQSLLYYHFTMAIARKPHAIVITPKIIATTGLALFAVP